MKQRIPRRVFTAEFKRKAIKLVTEQGLRLAAARGKLNVGTKSLRTWIEQYERRALKASLGASKLMADQQRIRELLSISKNMTPSPEAYFRQYLRNLRNY